MPGRRSRASEPVQHAVAALSDIGVDHLILVSDRVKKDAVVLRSLCGRDDVALHYVRLDQMSNWKRKAGLAIDYTIASLNEWSAALSDDAEVVQVLQQPLHKRRQQLERFLAEFEAHSEIHRLHSLGLKVPSAFVIVEYAKALKRRRLSDATQEHLTRIESKATTAKQWNAAFRRRWALEWGSGHIEHGVAPSTLKSRAAVFFRWLYWILATLASDTQPVVINMDETMLSNVKMGKHGVVRNWRQTSTHHLEHVPRDAGMPRISLLATICSDSAVQRDLPQIRLPRRRAKGAVGRSTLAAYAAAGLPQIAYHGGSGWNNAATMSCYLRELRRRVNRSAPDRPVVLVMDDCSIHICDEVLALCKKLRIAVAIIPSRMTWVLQPLDTHVFAQLKADIRRTVFSAIAAGTTGKLAAGERIRLHGQSIRRILVERDWSSVVERAGLKGPGYELRPAVSELLEGADLTARLPTAQELADTLQVPPRRSLRLLQLLTATVQPAPVLDVDVGPDVAEPPVAAAAAAAVLMPAPRLRLGGRNRLPPARPSTADAANYIFRPFHRSPIVTRRRSSTHLGSASSAAASGSGARSSRA